MPPQNTQSNSGPEKFDFMLKDQPKPPRRLGGLFAWMPRPAKLALLGLGGLFVIIIFYLIFFGGKATNADQLISIMARGQEISRVSLLVQQQAKNAETTSLAATVETVLNSQKKELANVLSEAKEKVDPKKLTARLDKSTDTALASALQNNSYDQAYFNYLKTGLAGYQSSLQTVYNSAGPRLKAILSADFDSIKTILAAPQLK